MSQSTDTPTQYTVIRTWVNEMATSVVQAYGLFTDPIEADHACQNIRARFQKSGFDDEHDFVNYDVIILEPIDKIA